MDSKNGETVENNGEKSSEREKTPGILGTHQSDPQNQGSKIPLNHIEFNKTYSKTFLLYNYAKII